MVLIWWNRPWLKLLLNSLLKVWKLKKYFVINFTEKWKTVAFNEKRWNILRTIWLQSNVKREKKRLIKVPFHCSFLLFSFFLINTQPTSKGEQHISCCIKKVPWCNAMKLLSAIVKGVQSNIINDVIQSGEEWVSPLWHELRGGKPFVTDCDRSG